MGTYRKKPVEIDAVRWMGDNWHEIEAAFGNPKDVMRDGASSFLYVNTLEGRARCPVGDWLIRGASADYYPCRDDVFHENYESLDVLEAH